MTEAKYLSETDTYWEEEYVFAKRLPNRDIHYIKRGKVVKSRKEYKCNYCNRKITIGEQYTRANIKNIGIFHYCKHCTKIGDRK